mmetsp:Transcript_32542/g.73497  ORF Transcript_32542/g.73497 Transcript_32542/m.73497 type:complete len:355 (-) Transcript_32542:212-1276(-)
MVDPEELSSLPSPIANWPCTSKLYPALEPLGPGVVDAPEEACVEGLLHVPVVKHAHRAAKLALDFDLLVVFDDLDDLAHRKQVHRAQHLFVAAAAGSGLGGLGVKEGGLAHALEDELDHVLGPHAHLDHSGRRQVRHGLQVRHELPRDLIGGAREELDRPAPGGVDGARRVHVNPRRQSPLPLLRLRKVVVDVLRHFPAPDLGDGGIGRRAGVAREELCPHHEQVAPPHARPDVQLALGVGRQRDPGVSDEAARLHLSIGDGEDAVQRPVALKAHLESLLALEPIGDHQRASYRPPKRRGRQWKAFLLCCDVLDHRGRDNRLRADEAIGAYRGAEFVLDRASGRYGAGLGGHRQ